MKKLIALTLSLASLGFVATSAEAKAAGSPAAKIASHASAPQSRRQNDRGRNHDRWDRRNRNHRPERVRTVIQTRIVRYHGRAYRETIQVKYWPNGRTETRVLNRVWIR